MIETLPVTRRNYGGRPRKHDGLRREAAAIAANTDECVVVRDNSQRLLISNHIRSMGFVCVTRKFDGGYRLWKRTKERA